MNPNFYKNYHFFHTVPPVVSIELLPAAALSESGNGLRLRCIVLTGQPRRLLKVHWFRNGNHFASTPSYYFPTNEDINEEINELALSNLTESDLQANYSCSGYNGINRFGPISAPKALRTFLLLLHFFSLALILNF